MCLNIKPKQAAQTAKDTIVCYKSVDKSLRGLSSGIAYELRSTNKGHFRWTSGAVHTSTLRKSGETIQEGLHTYATMDGAMGDSGNVILVCEIPIGARYYNGSHNGNNDGYASNQLIVREILDKARVKSDNAVRKQNIAVQISKNKAFKEIQKQIKILKSLS